MENLEQKLKSKSHIGVFLLRLFVGTRLIYGVFDNVISWEQMLEFSTFLEVNNFPFPTLNAVISVYVQFIGGVLLIIGYKTRITAIILMINFLIASWVHILGRDSIEVMTPALAILFCCITFLFVGGERFSVDWKIKNRKKS